MYWNRNYLVDREVHVAAAGSGTVAGVDTAAAGVDTGQKVSCRVTDRLVWQGWMPQKEASPHYLHKAPPHPRSCIHCCNCWIESDCSPPYGSECHPNQVQYDEDGGGEGEGEEGEGEHTQRLLSALQSSSAELCTVQEITW